MIYKILLLLIFVLGLNANQNVFADAKYYSDNTRELFYLPKVSAEGGADIVFYKNGSPQSNSALLGIDSASEISLSYSSYYQNVFSTSIISYYGMIDERSGFGISISYLYNPQIPNTEDLDIGNDGHPIYDPTKIKYSSESIIYFHAGYGYKFIINKRINAGIGISLNATRHKLPFNVFKGYGIGIDAGSILEFSKIGLRVALICDNLTTQYTKWSNEYSEYAYPHLRFGIGWMREIPYIAGRLMAVYKSLDILSNEGANTTNMPQLFGADTQYSATEQNLNIPQDIPKTASLFKEPLLYFLSGNIGVEYMIKDVFSIRFGHNVINNLTFGCGLAVFKKRLIFDFAYLSHELAPTYQICVTYKY